MQPFPRSKRSVRLSTHSAFQLGKTTLIEQIDPHDRKAHQQHRCRHLLSSLNLLTIEALWRSLPAVYHQCAVCYTDFWASYDAVMPANRHRAVGKASGKTNHIERFNGTLRQRVSRLVRKTLSFSKKLENHIGAIGYFIHHYNARLRTVDAV